MKTIIDLLKFIDSNLYQQCMQRFAYLFDELRAYYNNSYDDHH